MSWVARERARRLLDMADTVRAGRSLENDYQKWLSDRKPHAYRTG